jgi:hypothetical protein
MLSGAQKAVGYVQALGVALADIHYEIMFIELLTLRPHPATARSFKELSCGCGGPHFFLWDQAH